MGLELAFSLFLSVVGLIFFLYLSTRRTVVQSEPESSSASPEDKKKEVPKEEVPKPATSSEAAPASAPKPRKEKKKEKKKEKGGKDKGKDEGPIVDPVKVKEHTEAEQACAGCPVQCSDHTSYPQSVLSKIDRTTDLLGTVKSHKKHYMLCFGTDARKWKKDIAEENSYASAFSKALDSFKIPARVTLVDIPSRGVEDIDEECDVMVLPDMIMYRKVKKDQISTLLEATLVKKTVPTEIPSVKLEKKSYVFICAHKLRDNRCGISGPILVDEFGKYLREHHLDLDVEVASISHIGGHAWAGNVIVYPEGTWYGRVMPCHVHAIVEQHILKKQILKPLLRGSIEFDKEDSKEKS